MATITGTLRKINYPLNRNYQVVSASQTGSLVEPVLDWTTLDPDEVVSITLNLSLNEYIALASAIDVGRDIAYGNNSSLIWWIWVRAVNPMAFCEQVDDCIENNPSTIITINNTLLSSGVVNPDQIQPDSNEMDNRFPLPQREQDSAPPPPGCDKDALWSGILEIVERLDKQGLDFLEGIVAENDKVERITNIVDIVPLFGDIAADVITIVSDIAQDLENAYVAHSSQTVLEDTACALFELVCEECRYPTYDEIYAHYANAGITGIDDIANITLTGIVDFMIQSNSLGNLFVWYTMNSVALFIMGLGGTFAGKRGVKNLEIWADYGENTPDDSWKLLCDGCLDTWCYLFDFTVNNGAFLITDNPGWSPDFGSWSATGWEAVFANGVSNNHATAVDIYRDFTSSTITKVTMVYDYASGFYNQTYQKTYIQLNNLAVQTALQIEVAPYDGNDKNLVWTGSVDADNIHVRATPAYWLGDDTGQAHGDSLIKSIKLEGNGSNPFGSDNC